VKKSNFSFVVAVVVLALAAVAINGAARVLTFKKKRVEVAMPLKSVPGQLGPWKQLTADRALDSEMEHTLGTSEYIMRTYVDTRVVPAESLDGFDDGSADETKRRAAWHAYAAARQAHPEAFVQFATTYYTGMVDTVAHIPDRCYVADGFEPTESPRVVEWQAPGKSVKARFINFEDQTPDRGKQSRNVGYFFQVNGEYEHDPITGVRLKLQDLREKYAYYAKVEMMVEGVTAAKAESVMGDFVASALPAVERCMPDWAKVREAEVAGRPIPGEVAGKSE
jgi:hypothetical protein